MKINSELLIFIAVVNKKLSISRNLFLFQITVCSGMIKFPSHLFWSHSTFLSALAFWPGVLMVQQCVRQVEWEFVKIFACQWFLFISVGDMTVKWKIWSQWKTQRDVLPQTALNYTTQRPFGAKQWMLKLSPTICDVFRNQCQCFG